MLRHLFLRLNADKRAAGCTFRSLNVSKIPSSFHCPSSNTVAVSSLVEKVANGEQQSFDLVFGFLYSEASRLGNVQSDEVIPLRQSVSALHLLRLKKTNLDHCFIYFTLRGVCKLPECLGGTNTVMCRYKETSKISEPCRFHVRCPGASVSTEQEHHLL